MYDNTEYDPVLDEDEGPYNYDALLLRELKLEAPIQQWAVSPNKFEWINKNTNKLISISFIFFFKVDDFHFVIVETY